MIDLLTTIQPFIHPNSTLIVGLSGGPDSVCLLTLLSKLQSKLNLKIIAAHLDHQWRPESSQDALWCKELCLALRNVTYVSATPRELNFEGKYNGSKEEMGRKLRRAFFQDLAEKFQANHIVLAHHADDQQETFFIRLIRGCSITGLAAMQQQDDLYLRPLLTIHKQDILHYLMEHKIPFLTDSTNVDFKFLRNRIRHELMPKLTKIDQRFTQNLTNCIQQLQKTDDFLNQYVEQTLQRMSNPAHHEQINIAQFLSEHEVIQHRILLHLLIKQNITVEPSHALFTEIIRFLHNNKSKQHQIHTTGLLLKQANHFSFKSL